MRRWNLLVFVMFALTLVQGCIFGAEPQYQGETLSYWVARSKDASPTLRMQAIRPLKELGEARRPRQVMRKRGFQHSDCRH